MAGKILDGFPSWCQLRDPSPTLGDDPYAATDCGEECCSIVQYREGRGYSTAFDIRLAMPGHADHGETTDVDLTQYLKSVGIDGKALWVPIPRIRKRLWDSIDAGKWSIVLGKFVSPSTLHWVVAVGYGNDHAVFMDPWTGTMLCSHWAKFLAQCEGTLVST